MKLGPLDSERASRRQHAKSPNKHLKRRSYESIWAADVAFGRTNQNPEKGAPF